MIELTKLNGAQLVVNSDLIEFIESLPDSLITLTTGTKIMVREKIPEIIAAVVEYRRRIGSESPARFAGKPNPTDAVHHG
jgi:flagellar protein FlbD